MADVAICSASGDVRTAETLRRAISDARLSVWWDEAPGDDFWHSDDVIERIEAAKAAIIIWSRHSVASALFRTQANAARKQNKLIQVSADGEGAPAPFDRAQIADISDWQGEGGHSGWQQIVAQLEALTGMAIPKEAKGQHQVLPSLFARHSAGVADEPAASASPPSSGSSRSLLLAVPIGLLLILLLAVAGTAGWMTGLRHAARKAEPAAVPAAVFKPAIPRPGATSAKSPPMAIGAGHDSGSLREPGPVPATAERAEAPSKASIPRAPMTPSRSELRKRERAKASASSQAKAIPKERPAPPKIKYRFSENMRLFCQGAGKATPECRTFRQNAPRRRR